MTKSKIKVNKGVKVKQKGESETKGASFIQQNRIKGTHRDRPKERQSKPLRLKRGPVGEGVKCKTVLQGTRKK